MIRLLFFGDIFGRSGRNVIKKFLPSLKAEFEVDYCIANCENLASGRGITERTVNELFSAGIDAFTSGNHLWDKKEGIAYLTNENNILKPANYPSEAAGNSWIVLEKADKKLGVICMTGQVFMQACDSPWRVIKETLPVLKKETSAIILDFHAEATGEKRTMAQYLNGEISAVLGTHTHIQTADEEIMSEGTAYITDVGMNGPHDSVIGVQKELILKKTLTGMPVRFEPAKTGNQINAVYLEIDQDTGKSLKIVRIRRQADLEDHE